MSYQKMPPLSDQDLEVAINESLDRWSQSATPVYGVFYKGKHLIMSRARVYYHKGAAKSQLIRNFKYSVYIDGKYYNDFDRAYAKKYIEKLLASGDLEIKQL
jgi:hypothetical protein